MFLEEELKSRRRRNGPPTSTVQHTQPSHTSQQAPAFSEPTQPSCTTSQPLTSSECSSQPSEHSKSSHTISQSTAVSNNRDENVVPQPLAEAEKKVLQSYSHRDSNILEDLDKELNKDMRALKSESVTSKGDIMVSLMLVECLSGKGSGCMLTNCSLYRAPPQYQCTCSGTRLLIRECLQWVKSGTPKQFFLFSLFLMMGQHFLLEIFNICHLYCRLNQRSIAESRHPGTMVLAPQ